MMSQTLSLVCGPTGSSEGQTWLTPYSPADLQVPTPAMSIKVLVSQGAFQAPRRLLASLDCFQMSQA